MGIIWSRFRKKESTKDLLQKIQEEITSLEEYREHTEQRRKKLVGSLIAYSIFFCLIAAIIFYFYYLPPTLEERLLYATSFVGFIILIYIIKKLLTCYYRWKVRRNENKLSALKDKKEDILNQVMETETYKIAKEILEIYAPEQIRKASMTIKSPITTPVVSSQRMPLSQGGDLRRRIISPQTSQTFSQRPIHTPARPGGMSATMSYGRPIATPRPQQVIRPNVSTPALQGPRIRFSSVSPMNNLPYARSDGGMGQVGNNGGGEPPGPPMPRPILPRERGILDRFVEYLVGDGPSNRYALVCKQCESHNGMALRDEFPYIAFRCAYCFYWNPARKQKPTAPRLEPIQQRSADLSRRMLDKEEESSTEEEEEDGSEESDSSSASNPSSGDTEEGSLEGCSDTPIHNEGEGAQKESLKMGSSTKVEDIQFTKQGLQLQPESHAFEKETEATSTEKETGQSTEKKTGQSSEKKTGQSSEKETEQSSESAQSIEADVIQPQPDVIGTDDSVESTTSVKN